MSTKFGVIVDNKTIEIAHRFSMGDGKTGVSWLNDIAKLLPDSTPVVAINNSNQGVETVGDLRKILKKRKNSF